jgi:hypothetical protein
MLTAAKERPADDYDFRLYEHRQRKSRVEKDLDYIVYLNSLNKKRTHLCPCGQHIGISFIKADGTVEVENMCPKVWWIRRARISIFRLRDTAQFLQKPMREFLEDYAI